MSLTKIPFFPRNYINNCCCHSIKPFILDVVCLTELYTRFHGNVLKFKTFKRHVQELFSHHEA